MKPTNLIIIMSDEHAGGVTGIERHPIVQTPHLDALARKGTLFTRASFATDRYIHDIRHWDNANAYDGRICGWGHALQDAGCRVESIGKLHYRSSGDPTGFDVQHDPMHMAGAHRMVWGLLRDPLPIFTARKARSVGRRLQGWF